MKTIVDSYLGIEAASRSTQATSGRLLLYVDYEDSWEHCLAACTSKEALLAAKRLLVGNVAPFEEVK